MYVFINFEPTNALLLMYELTMTAVSGKLPAAMQTAGGTILPSLALHLLVLAAHLVLWAGLVGGAPKK